MIARQLSRFACVVACLFGVSVAARQLTQAADWNFPEIIVDARQPRSYRGRDNQLHHQLDLNRDRRLDLVNFKCNGPAYYIPGPKDPKSADGNWKYHLLGDAGGTGAVGDLDGDGDLDLATRDAWLENPGDPQQVPWPRHAYQALGSGPQGKVAIGDLNGDGHLDVAVSSEEHTDGIAFYVNPGGDARGTWSMRPVISPDAGWHGLHSLQLDDMDGDGDMDVFTAEMHNRAQQRVAVCENADGRGNKWIVHVLANTGSHNAKLADLNGDGAPDIVGKNYGGDMDIISVGWTHSHVLLYENLSR